MLSGKSLQSVFGRNEDCLYWVQHWIKENCCEWPLPLASCWVAKFRSVHPHLLSQALHSYAVQKMKTAIFQRSESKWLIKNHDTSLFSITYLLGNMLLHVMPNHHPQTCSQYRLKLQIHICSAAVAKMVWDSACDKWRGWIHTCGAFSVFLPLLSWFLRRKVMTPNKSKLAQAIFIHEQLLNAALPLQGKKIEKKIQKKATLLFAQLP